MMGHLSHKEYVDRQRAKVASLAAKVLKKEMSMIEGAKEIVTLCYELDVDDSDEDILAFVLIESETDHLPIGKVRRFWDEDALVEKEPEVQEAERWAQGVGAEACKNLVERFGRYNRDS
jgi:hypothetical protein